MNSQRLATKSPIHVHVARNTPVHVHVKKVKKKPAQVGVPSAVEQRIAQSNSSTTLASSVFSNKESARKAASYKPRSTPSFIPPGNTSSIGRSISWEGPSHRLEINQPTFSGKKKSLRRVNDLSNEEENIDGKDTMYESEISCLLDEVGTLRTEVALQNTSRVVDKKNEHFTASRKILEDQEDELLGYKSELNTTILENEKLRHSMDKYKDIAQASRSEVEHIESEKDQLLRKLVEVEVDGKAAGQEVSKLRDHVRRLKQDKKLTISDVSEMTQQREILMQKLEDFDKTNRTLRMLLKQAHKKEEQSDHLTQQRDVLLRKLAEAEAQFAAVTTDFVDRDRQIDALLTQVDADKEQARTFQELQKTIEATRGHLQNQLKTKEGENNRMAVKIRELEQEMNQRLTEVEHLEALLSSSRSKSSKEKDALKKATRIQRDRANKKENAAESLQIALSAREEEVAMLAGELDAFKEKYMKTHREKAALEASVIELRSQMSELEQIMDTANTGRNKKGSTQSLTGKIRSLQKSLEAYRSKSENLEDAVTVLTGQLKTVEKSSALKNSTSQSEIAKLQLLVNEYETLIAEFRLQIDRCRKENDELNDTIYQKEKELKRQIHLSSVENEKAVARFEKKMAELQLYPDLLKTAEIHLHDAQERVLSHEKRSTEHARLIADLTQKVESQAQQLETVREKYHEKQADFKQVQSRMETTERQYEDADLQRRELMNAVSSREDSVHSLQERLEEQRNENARLMQQLETALADARRQADVQKEKALSKERTAQARIFDLESQLTRSTATAEQFKRGKDEAERKYNSRLQDMRDRLEQANTTTRSMQGYVSFLKSSYASVFNDGLDSSFSSPRPY